VARKADYSVQRVPHAVAAAFIAAHHYSASSANTSVYAFGLYRCVPVGAALRMPPAAGAAKWWATHH
jgi:hypothetical protein